MKLVVFASVTLANGSDSTDLPYGVLELSRSRGKLADEVDPPLCEWSQDDDWTEGRWRLLWNVGEPLAFVAFSNPRVHVSYQGWPEVP